MTSTSEPWALYIRPGGRYIVKRYDPERTGLWATLGPLYDRDKAQKLADTLTRDDRENNPMDPSKPGTRCECGKTHGSGYHRYTGKCTNDAVRLVTVTLPLGPEFINDMTATQPDDISVPMCAACADFHEANQTATRLANALDRRNAK